MMHARLETGVLSTLGMGTVTRANGTRARRERAMSSQPSGAHALTAVPTSLERRWHLSFERLRPLLQQPCEAAASASLHSLVHESRDGEREVAQALLYGLLTQPHVAALLFRLICCLRDVELAVSGLLLRRACIHACMRASHICTCSWTLHMHMHMHRGHV